jgi:hypothetical protein
MGYAYVVLFLILSLTILPAPLRAQMELMGVTGAGVARGERAPEAAAGPEYHLYFSAVPGKNHWLLQRKPECTGEVATRSIGGPLRAHRGAPHGQSRSGRGCHPRQSQRHPVLECQGSRLQDRQGQDPRLRYLPSLLGSTPVDPTPGLWYSSVLLCDATGSSSGFS